MFPCRKYTALTESSQFHWLIIIKFSPFPFYVLQMGGNYLADEAGKPGRVTG